MNSIHQPRHLLVSVQMTVDSTKGSPTQVPTTTPNEPVAGTSGQMRNNMQVEPLSLSGQVATSILDEQIPSISGLQQNAPTPANPGTINNCNHQNDEPLVQNRQNIQIRVQTIRPTTDAASAGPRPAPSLHRLLCRDLCLVLERSISIEMVARLGHIWPHTVSTTSAILSKGFTILAPHPFAFTPHGCCDQLHTLDCHKIYSVLKE